jgi:hypothetical protein
MTDLALISAELQRSRAQLRRAILAVRSSDDPDYVEEIRGTARIGYEAVRIKDLAEQIRRELLRLEITCLRRLVDLAAVDVLRSKSMQAAARWYHDLTEDEVDQFVLTEHGSASTALTAFYSGRHRFPAWREEQYQRELAEDEAAWKRGQEIASGERPQDRDEALEPEAWARPAIRDAITTLLDEYASDGSAFHVADVADRVISELNVDDEDLALGIREICRKAVASDKILTLDGKLAPRFLCVPIDGRWIRIPFENGTLADLERMIHFRRHQIVESERALARLEALHDHLDPGPGSDHRGETLSQLALRKAATRAAAVA